MKWGNKVKLLREKNGWNQEDLAKNSGLTVPHISKIESDDFISPTVNVIEKLAKAFNKSPAEISAYLYGNTSADIPVSSSLEWDKHASDNTFLKINVYPDYARVHAGEPVDAIDHIYIDRPEKAPFNIKAYRVEGNCMEPFYHNGEYVIVDHDQAIGNGDKVVALCDGELHIAKLKMIGGEYFLENRQGTKKITDCQGIAKVIGHYGK